MMAANLAPPRAACALSTAILSGVLPQSADHPTDSSSGQTSIREQVGREQCMRRCRSHPAEFISSGETTIRGRKPSL